MLRAQKEKADNMQKQMNNINGDGNSKKEWKMFEIKKNWRNEECLWKVH